MKIKDNVDEIWFDYSYCYAKFPKSNTSCSLPYLNARDGEAEIGIHGVDTSIFKITTSVDRSTDFAYITLNYTKTTDQGNSTTIPPTPAN